MSNTKQALTKIEKIINSQANPTSTITYKINGEDINIEVKRSISKEDKASFIMYVVDNCFDGGIYSPIFKSELFNIALLEYYTDISVDIPVDTLFEITTNTDIISKVEDIIENNCLLYTQLSSIRRAINDMIEYRKQEILSTQKQELDNIIETIEESVTGFSEIGDKFKDINVNELIPMLQKIANKDEYALTKAVLDIQTNDEINSDISGEIKGQTILKNYK